MATHAIAVGTTDDNGEFSVNLPEEFDEYSLLYVDIHGAEDGSTSMNCDAIHCGSLDVIQGEDTNQDGILSSGENVFLSSDFHLSSVVSNAGQENTLRVSVTPLSHFAVEQAKAEGDLSDANIQRYMLLLASTLNLSASLSQLHAVDPTLMQGDLADLYTILAIPSWASKLNDLGLI